MSYNIILQGYKYCNKEWDINTVRVSHFVDKIFVFYCENKFVGSYFCGMLYFSGP